MGMYLVGNKSYLIILAIIILRYALIAGIAFFIFYVVKKHAWSNRRIQRKFPSHRDYVREIGYSIVTALIFAAVGYMVFLTPLVDYTRAYFEIDEHGFGYLTLSVVLIILVHDTYFYWMHRLMHNQLIYKWVHKVHHLSINPSPWAAMAFHPIEAILEAGIIVVVAFLFPIHPLAIGIFLLFMTIYNVYGHLGYELYPKDFATSTIGRWINTSVNHNQHHQYFKGNYGLYFLFWDRVMGTIRNDYEGKFEEVNK